MSGRGLIINVDDSEHGRYAKGRLLSLAGFSVFEADCGQEALRLVLQHKPDLVLLDVNLPDLSGIEVCRRIKLTPETCSVIVLQISASAISAPQAVVALDRGADAYLTEPVDPEVLIATIKALLRTREAERELSAVNERLRLLNQELRRSNEDLQQFAFIASHDLQEPLRTVTSFVGLLERTATPKLSESEKEYLYHIAEGSRRMRALIEDLLTYSRLGAKLESVQVVDLNSVVSWALANLRESIEESGADVTCESLPSVTGDEAQLGHLLQNLIGNAIKYSQRDVQPVIHLNAQREKNDWIIRIRDNGMGIDSAYHTVIFGPFKRLHGREIPGTGIGLALCRRVVEAHGGQIWVDSKAGEGSTFSFSMPVSRELQLA